MALTLPGPDIDISKLKKRSEEIRSVVKGAMEEVERIMSSPSTPRGTVGQLRVINQRLGELVTASEEAEEHLNKVMSEATTVPTATYGRIQDKIKEYQKAIDDLKAAGGHHFDAEIAWLQKFVADPMVSAEYRQLAEELERVDDVIKNQESYFAADLEIIEQARAELEELERVYNAYIEQGGSDDTIVGQNLKAQVDAQRAALDEMETNYDTMLASLTAYQDELVADMVKMIDDASADIARLQEENNVENEKWISNYQQKIAELEKQLQKLRDAGKDSQWDEESTKRINEAAAAVEELTNKTRAYVEMVSHAHWDEEHVEETKGITATIKKAVAGAGGLSGVKDDISGVIAALGGLNTMTGHTGRVIQMVLQKVKLALAGNPLGLIILAVTAALTQLIKMINQTKKQVEALLKSLGKYTAKALQDVGKGLLALGKGFVSLGTGVIKGVLSGFTALASKLLSLKGVIKENLDIMAKMNKGNNAVNTALSNLTSSLTYVKGALAAAFAPILTYVEPALTSLMDKLAEVINMVGMFIAKLTGATSYQKAVRKQKDYAKSLSGVGKAAGEANKKLAEYDKLVVIDQQKDTGAGVDFEETDLENIPVPAWLEDLYTLGQKVGTFLRDFLNGIPWEKIQTGAQKAAQGIADFVNGLMSVAGLGDSVGHTLAQLLNTFTTFVNTLLTGIDFTQIGKQIRGMLDTLLGEADFGAVGDIFSNALNALADLIIGIFGNPGLGALLAEKMTELLQHALDIDWAKVKEAALLLVHTLVEFLNGFITPENLILIGHTLAQAINTVISSAWEFVKGADWAGWGESIGTGLMTMLDEIDFATAGKTLSGLATGLLDMILAAIDQIDWDDVTDKFMDFITNIDWAGIGSRATEISQKLMEGLQKIWDTFKDSDTFQQIIDLIVDFLKEKKNWETAFKRIKHAIIREVVWEKIKDGLAGIGENILTHIKESFDLVKIVGEMFGDISDAFKEKDWGRLGLDILNGLTAALLAPAQFLGAPFGALWDWIWGGICDIFGIASPAKNMMPAGENIVLGILEGFGLVDFAGKISEWWDTNVAPWFTYERWAELGENMKRAVGEKIQQLKDNLSAKWTEIKTNVDNKVTEIKTNLAAKWDAIKTNLTTKVTAIKTTIETNFNNLKTKVLDIFTNIKNGILNVWTTLSEAIKRPINNILSGIETFINNVINGLNGMISAVNGLHFDLPDWVPLVGGKTLGFTIPSLSTVSLPRLAQGAVIPPNKEFAAILGDQRSGTNIETPLDTMVQAFKQALAETGGVSHQPIVLQLNGKTVAQAVWDEEKKKYKQTGGVVYS